MLCGEGWGGRARCGNLRATKRTSSNVSVAAAVVVVKSVSISVVLVVVSYTEVSVKF